MPQNPETMGPLELNRTPETQIEDLLSEFHPGDQILEWVRSSSNPERQLMSLRLMREHLTKFPKGTVTTAVC